MDPTTSTVQTPDGRSLTTFTWGTGDRSVVLEAGLGLGGRCWGPVARLLPPTVRAVAYDRAGYGTSTTDPSPRTLDRLAEDLSAVVAGQPSPVLLVGHSWGGPVVRRAAQVLPAGTVSGLVLVDPSDEGADLYLTRLAALMDEAQSQVMPLLATSGVLRPALAWAVGRHLPAQDRAATVRASSSVRAARAAAAENRHVRAGLLQLEAAADAPDLPTTIVSGTASSVSGVLRALLVRAHRESAEREGGRHVEAEKSHHLVLLTEPDVVAREIVRLLDGD